MTQFPDLFAALSAPFNAQETRVRTPGGRQVQYITARTAMNRLDSVLGPVNWWDEYVPGESSVLCRLTIRLPDGSTLTKANAGGYAGMPDQGDDDKSGFSDSFKRAAVKFGVGRYLYRDGVPAYKESAQRAEEPERVDEAPDRDDPESSPGVDAPSRTPTRRLLVPAGPCSRGRRNKSSAIRWASCATSNGWAKLQDFPGRMVDWDADQVNQAYGEAIRKLQAIPAGHAEVYEEALAN